jgi:hypothetical protein
MAHNFVEKKLLLFLSLRETKKLFWRRFSPMLTLIKFLSAFVSPFPFSVPREKFVSKLAHIIIYLCVWHFSRQLLKSLCKLRSEKRDRPINFFFFLLQWGMLHSATCHKLQVPRETRIGKSFCLPSYTFRLAKRIRPHNLCVC